MSTENERERAQLERAILPDDGHAPALIVANIAPSGHGFSFRGMRLATPADVARLAPKPPRKRYPSRGPRCGTALK